MRLHRTDGLLLAVLVLAGAVFAPAATTQDIPSPDNWVAFEADETLTGLGRPEAVYGRFYQGADGSTRHETGPRPTEMRVVDIKNISLSRWFVWGGGQWYSYPMILPKTGRTPRKMSEGSVKPVAPVANIPFDLHEVTLSERRTQLVAAALNFFAIVEERVDDYRLERTNITIQAQDPTVFLPPAGATVVECPQPGGIVVSAGATPDAQQYAPCGPRSPKP